MRIKFIVKDKSNQPIKNARVKIKYELVDTILLTMDPLKRFNNVEGPLKVKYDASLGNLAGEGGAVESFVVEFLPEGLTQKPNPYIPETISVGMDVELDFIEVHHSDYSSLHGTIKAMPGTINIDFIGVGEINP